MTGLDKLTYTLATLFIIAVMTTLFLESEKCEADGGSYVRGLFWYECINK